MEQQKNNTDKTSALYEAIIEAYLLWRQPTPDAANDGAFKVIQENMTTEDIRDALRDMADIPATFILSYMLHHGYTVTTESDGTVKWAIWRTVI